MKYISRNTQLQGVIIPLTDKDKVNVTFERGTFTKNFNLEVVNFKNYSLLLISQTELNQLPEGEYRMILDNYESLIKVI